ncbi:MAG: glycosyltransferase family 39 protein, partial [Bdellovibrionales bacterium]|nr:glycosyltransferase family 39 protein [Bdellovibrionales bacterium]
MASEKKHPTFFWGTIAAIILLLEISMVFSTRILNWDEGYYLSAALGFIRSGTLSVKMWNIPEPTSLIIGAGQGFGALIYFYFLKFFGYSLINARLFSLVCGLVSLFLCYRYVCVVLGRQFGACAVLASLYLIFFLQSIAARTDSLAFVILFSILLLEIRVRAQNSKFSHFLFGFAAILAMEFHILACVYAAAIALIYLTDYFATKTKLQNLLSYLAGGACGAGTFVYLHLMRNSDAFFLILQQCAYCEGSYFSKQLNRLSQFIDGYLPEIILVLLILIWCAYKSRQDKQLSRSLYLFLFTTLIYFLLIPGHYEYFLWPLLTPCLGYVGYTVFNHETKDLRLVRVGFSFLFCLVAFRTAAVAFATHLSSTEDVIVQSEMSCIKSVTSKDAVVAGPGSNFIWFTDYSNYIEIGRGSRYGALLNFPNEIDFKSSMFSFIEARDPVVVWGGKSDDPVTEKLFLQYASSRPDYFIPASSNLYLSRRLPVETSVECSG